MKPTFIYSRSDAHATFCAYCGSPAEAIAVKDSIQTISGVALERDHDLIYAVVDLDRIDETILELEKDGYSTTDGNGPDFNPAEDTT